MEKQKKKFQVPHVYALLTGLIIICAILTYIIPAGAYDMMVLEDGREVVDPDTCLLYTSRSRYLPTSTG